MNSLFSNIDYKTLIQNISGIGTFLTSLISLVTLFVIIKQRRDSFRPRVIFSHRSFAKCISENDQTLKTRWVYKYKKDPTEEFPFCYELLNVGVGIAENVTIKEVFDYKRAWQFIKDLDKNNEFTIDFDNDMFTIRTNFDKSYIMTFIDIKKRELGTFFTNHQDNNYKFVFTDTCLAFLSCFDYLREKSDNPYTIKLDKFPRCKYVIEYSDFEGKKYKSEYECKITSLTFDSYIFEFLKK